MKIIRIPVILTYCLTIISLMLHSTGNAQIFVQNEHIKKGWKFSNIESPSRTDTARVSLNARCDQSPGLSLAMKINLWARLGDGDRALKLLRNLLTLQYEIKTIYGESGGGVYSNLFDSHPPFQIDGNFGATAGYCEMLVQSNAGQIQLLPALPSYWATGSVKGLCARGGFIVDLSWKDHQLTKAVIQSKSGQSCKVIYGHNIWESDTNAGTTYCLDHNLKIEKEIK
jgi:alpha-L-fucosidase 2